MKLKTLLSLILLFCFQPHSFASEPLLANYEITVKHNNHDHPESTRQLNLWRLSANQVVHQFSQQQLSQHWTLQKNNRVKLLKLFDAHDRGVEYAAEDIKGHQKRDWSEKYQLLSDDFLAQLSLVKSYQDETYGTVQVLSVESDTRKLLVEWLPEHKLLKSVRSQGPQSSEHWQLVNLSADIDKIKSQAQLWDKYYLTDYADIGDNESDPFLMQMINLGFVEEAASGFYNDKGQQIQGQHSHHH